ncbi:MAG: four-carbon acid sugar kinase family protein [Rhodospirillales bacterium]
MLLGCIGDDFTGSSDLGLMLAREGMHTVQYVGTPDRPAGDGVDAGIVALKTRTCPPAEAVRQSLEACRWLAAQGCRQFFFKYCSTFDSTPEGNIGPVIDALMDELGTDRAIVCPVFPATGRQLFQGHLFVGDRLLNESGMQNHPLTPMTDPDIRRWLAPQTRHGVGHVAFHTVLQGGPAIEAGIGAEVAAGRPVVVIDAVTDEDLRRIGVAAAGIRLVTGGSGIALGLPANLIGTRTGDAAAWRGESGPAVILSGSCSTATQGQVADHARNHPALVIDPEQVLDGRQDAESVAGWLLERAGDMPIAYSTAAPESVTAIQARFGRDAAANAVEELFAGVARRLEAGGVKRIIVAGGETSGAVTSALGVRSMEIGPEIAPGVPALRVEGKDLVLALKSGNFGGPGFFGKALDILGGQS